MGGGGNHRQLPLCVLASSSVAVSASFLQFSEASHVVSKYALRSRCTQDSGVPGAKREVLKWVDGSA